MDCVLNAPADYYEQCDNPHVDITNSPIVQFTSTGITTEDGKHREFDIVAICTGYDAVTGGLRTMGIKGRGGIDLDEYWKDGISTHLGSKHPDGKTLLSAQDTRSYFSLS